MRSIFLEKRGEGTQIYIYVYMCVCNRQEEEEGGRERERERTRDITFARYRLIGIARFPIVSEKADFTGLSPPSLPLSLSLSLLFVRGLSPRLTFGALKRLKRERCNYRAGNKLVCHEFKSRSRRFFPIIPNFRFSKLGNCIQSHDLGEATGPAARR